MKLILKENLLPVSAAVILFGLLMNNNHCNATSIRFLAFRLIMPSWSLSCRFDSLLLCLCDLLTFSSG